MTRNLAQRPCFRAFCETLAFISGDLGPQDFCALRRLAAICLAVAINLVLQVRAACATRWNYWAGVCARRGPGGVKRLVLQEEGEFSKVVTGPRRAGCGGAGNALLACCLTPGAHLDGRRRNKSRAAIYPHKDRSPGTPVLFKPSVLSCY